GLVLGQDAGEGGDDLARGGGEAAPTLGGLFRNAGAGEDQFHAAPVSLEDEIGPQFAFDEDSRGRPPVVEEGAHGAGRIHRGELVNDAGRQATGQQGRGGQGARGDQNGQVGALVAQAFDHGQQGQGLADA